jgi:hypothetical protein
VAIGYSAGKILEYAARKSMELEKPGAAGQVILIWPYAENGTLKKYTVKQGEAACAQVTPDVLAVSFVQGCYWCVHDGTGSKIKVTWEGEASVGSVLVMDAFTGVDPVTPIDVTGTILSGEATELTWASINIVTKNAWQIGMQVNVSGIGLKETPAGWTLRTNYSPQTFSRIREATGATGATTIKWNEKKRSARLSLALRPYTGATLTGEASASVGLDTTLTTGRWFSEGTAITSLLTSVEAVAARTGEASILASLLASVEGLSIHPKPGEAEALASLITSVQGLIALAGEADISAELVTSIEGLIAKLGEVTAPVELDTTAEGEKTEPVISQNFTLEGNILYDAVPA